MHLLLVLRIQCSVYKNENEVNAFVTWQNWIKRCDAISVYISEIKGILNKPAPHTTVLY